MKRRCAWAGCKRRPTTVCHYWGDDHELCDEHAALVGNDPPEEGAA